MNDQDFAKIAALVGDAIKESEQRRRGIDKGKTQEVADSLTGAIKDLLERTLKPLVARIVELERQR